MSEQQEQPKETIQDVLNRQQNDVMNLKRQLEDWNEKLVVLQANKSHSQNQLAQAMEVFSNTRNNYNMAVINSLQKQLAEVNINRQETAPKKETKLAPVKEEPEEEEFSEPDEDEDDELDAELDAVLSEELAPREDNVKEKVVAKTKPTKTVKADE